MLIAAQMWCLCRLLPIMIGDKVPADDPNWKNILLLLDIMDIVFSPVISQDQISYLAVLIEEHHSNFIKLYPSCPITPKLHYLLHYPQWISRYDLVHVHVYPQGCDLTLMQYMLFLIHTLYNVGVVQSYVFGACDLKASIIISSN